MHERALALRSQRAVDDVLLAPPRGVAQLPARALQSAVRDDSRVFEDGVEHLMPGAVPGPGRLKCFYYVLLHTFLRFRIKA